nr:helix-turn-helix domain-containing protein [Candidatus Njordarchaeota archaeon]
MSSDKSSEIIEIYTALSHPLRKKIVEIIGEREFIGFKYLKDVLNVSIGTLYYHLDMLEGFIAQNKEKKYTLTKKGKMALSLVGSSEERLKAEGVRPKAKEPSILSAFAREVLFARRLFASISSNPLRFIPEVLIVVGFGAWLFSQLGIEPIMMFYSHPPLWPSSIVIVGEFFMGWFAIFGFCEILSIAFFRRLGGEVNLLVSTGFSLLPLLILPVLLYIGRAIDPSLVFNWSLIDGLLLIFQGWVLCLLTAALGFSKGLKLEKAALVTLTVMYSNIGILLLVVLHL